MSISSGGASTRRKADGACESVYTYPELQPYVDPAFRPCAIICTTCGGAHLGFMGLGSVEDFGTVQLFAGAGYSPDPDG